MERKAVIFDLDGTLIDSEPNYQEADVELVRRYGGEMSPEEHDAYVGIGSRTFLEAVREKWGIEADLEEMLAEKDRLYMELARERTEVFPEMDRLVRRLKEEGTPLAVASGSSREVIRELTELTGIRGFFDELVSAEEVDRGKPAPDVFLVRTPRLETAPEACTRLEDSRYGVLAARAAGMACAAVPGTTAGGAFHPDFRKAELLFEGGIGEFTAARFLRWRDGDA